jgi:hypothetical protein
MSSKDVHPLIFAFREPFVVLERLSQNADFFSHTHLVFLMLGSWRGQAKSVCSCVRSQGYGLWTEEFIGAVVAAEPPGRPCFITAVAKKRNSHRVSNCVKTTLTLTHGTRLDHTNCMHFLIDKWRTLARAHRHLKKDKYTKEHAVAVGSHQDVKN